MSAARWAGIAAVAGAAVVGAALLASSALAASAPAVPAASAPTSTETSREVALAPVVAAWPAAYTVTGTKSEPLYTERIAVTRDGDRFGLRIEALSQGDAAMGTERAAVEVAPDGRVAWRAGCTKTPAECADDPALRGFLAAAALRSLALRDALPAVATLREFRGTPVVCVDDAALHPDAAPAAVALDPCFSVATGAVLAHWSAPSGAYVGPTLAPGFRESAAPDPALLAEVALPAPAPESSPSLHHG